MQCSKLVQCNIATCSPRDTLDMIARRMWECDVGCLPAIDDEGRVVGMITDRDVCMAAFLQGAPLRAITTSSVMTTEVVTCQPTSDVAEILRVMQQRQIRRLPVVDSAGKLVGMISINDLARAAHMGSLPSMEIAATLAAVTHPRLTHRPAA